MPDPSLHASRYEKWVSDYAQELYRFAYRLTGQRSAAEDLVQDTFSEAWRSIGKLRDFEKARSWLFQILRHRYSHWVGEQRRNRTERLAEESDDGAWTAQQPDADPARRMADRDEIQAGLNQLSPEIRLTFLMAVVENLTCREVAEQLDIPLGTVLSRIDSARRKLRVVLVDSDPRTRRPPSALKIAT